jgi:hypothetical protein
MTFGIVTGRGTDATGTNKTMWARVVRAVRARSATLGDQMGCTTTFPR